MEEMWLYEKEEAMKGETKKRGKAGERQERSTKKREERIEEGNRKKRGWGRREETWKARGTQQRM